MISVMKVLEKTKPSLVKRALDMRAQGKTFDEIATELSQKSGMKIGREGVRTWFKNREEA